ncbi:MAG: DUF2062 domain-containing protein [Candidatus Aminicenantes bacterium]|nr:DUF2062 domain-containing protein [Candidatus Aminicenantes bacterium]
MPLQKTKQYIRKFFLINDTPHKVAAGAALGIFLGIIPGEGFLATLALSSLFGLNRLAALAGVGAVNMWTTFLVFPPAAYVGGLIFRVKYEDLRASFENTTHLGFKYFLSKAVFFDLTLPLIVGFLIVAGAIALAVYFGLFYFLCRRKNFCERDHILLKEE